MSNESSEIQVSDLVISFERMLVEAEEMSQQLLAAQYVLGGEMQRGDISNKDLADLGFLHREISDVCNEMRKECDARKNLISKVLALKIIARCTEDPTLDAKVKGRLATATPDIHTEPIVPGRGTPEYRELMSSFGVKDEALDHSLLQPHFTRMMEYLTKRSEEGKAIPKGIGTRPVTRCTYVRRKRRPKAS